MARRHYAPSDYQSGQEDYRNNRLLTGRAQDEARRAEDVNALRAQQAALVQNGVSPARLPLIGNRMSPTDIAAAARTMAPQYQQLFGNPTTAVGSRTGTPLPAPVGTAIGGTAVPDAAQRRLMAASTNARLPQALPIPAGDPEARAFNGKTSSFEQMPAPVVAAAQSSTAPDPAVLAAAGRNVAVQTPYGAVSSRTAQPNERLLPATTTERGVARQSQGDWQARVLAKYPQVGVAGSPDNLAFVKSYKEQDAEHRRVGATFNPEAHADSLFAPKAKPAGPVVNAQGDTDPALAARKDFLNRRMTKAGDAQTVTQMPLPNPSYNDNPYVAAGKAVDSLFTMPITGEVDPGPDSTPAQTSAAQQRVRQMIQNAPSLDEENDAYMRANPVTPPTPPAYAAPTGTPATVAPTKPLAFNGFDQATQNDIAAFTHNPWEDEFKKRMRQPAQTDWMTQAAS